VCVLIVCSYDYFLRGRGSAFSGPNRKPILILISGVVANMIAAGMNVLCTFVNTLGAAYLVTDNFLVRKETGLEFTYIVLNFVALVVWAFCLAYSMWTGKVVGLYWQRYLLHDMQNTYFGGKTIYAANKMVPAMDNVDQRITDDTRMLTQGFFALLYGYDGRMYGAMQVRLAALCVCACCDFSFHRCSSSSLELSFKPLFSV
jgi:ABC-type uncharacterized transport system fused permease/ATPase subunit